MSSSAGTTSETRPTGGRARRTCARGRRAARRAGSRRAAASAAGARLEAGDHAVGDVRVEEGGVVGGDDDVGLAEQVERTAAGHAVDRRDDRLPEVVRFGLMLSPGSLNMNGVDTRPPGLAPSGRRGTRSIDSARSMPVQNAFSPAPVRTTARRRRSCAATRQTCLSSSCIALLKALSTSGRFSVTMATPSRSS